MQMMLAIAALMLSLSIIGGIVRGIIRDRAIVTTRNAFLAGLLLFQVNAMILPLATDQFGEIGPTHPQFSGTVMLGMLIAFTACFWVIYNKGWFRLGLQNKLGTTLPIPSDKAIMIMAVLLLVSMIIFRLVLIYIPFFNILALIIAPGLGAGACAAICWVWARNIRNPVITAMTVAIVLTAFSLAIYQQFGRRDALSVLAACLWGAFHGGLKNVNFRRAAIPFAIVGGIAFLTVAALTSSRTEKSVDLTVGQLFQRLFSADLVVGILGVVGGSDAGPISMWVVENRSDPSTWEFLHSVKYCGTMAFPRAIWDQYFSTPKPLAFGFTMIAEVGVTGKAPAFNVGPGLVGHMMNDNPLFAFPLYTIIIAAGLRLLDDRVNQDPNNPFAVIPVGCALGEIMALARGELGLFMFRTIVVITSAWIAVWLIGKVLVMAGAVPRPASAFEEEPDPLVDPRLAAEYAGLESQEETHG